MKVRILTPIVLFCLLVSVTSCRKTTPIISQTAPPAVQSNSSPAAKSVSHEVPAPSAFDLTFTGSLGSKYHITMKLKRAADKLTGTYAYNSSGDELTLEGSIAQDGSFTMTEKGDGGKTTGVFTGRAYLPNEASTAPLLLNGNWSKPNSDTKLPFALRELKFDLGGLQIAAREINEEQKKPKLTVGVKYPQLTGPSSPGADKFNNLVSSFVKGQVSDFKKELSADDVPNADPESNGSDISINYIVLFANKGIISLYINISTYSAGAAHPNNVSHTINFDLNAAKSISLADLFQPGSGYIQAISKYCVKDLKKRAVLDFPEGATPKAANFKDWNLTPDALVIQFDSYQVAPYAAGPQEVDIPYLELVDILNPDGVVRRITEP